VNTSQSRKKNPIVRFMRCFLRTGTLRPVIPLPAPQPLDSRRHTPPLSLSMTSGIKPKPGPCRRDILVKHPATIRHMPRPTKTRTGHTKGILGSMASSRSTLRLHQRTTGRMGPCRTNQGKLYTAPQDICLIFFSRPDVSAEPIHATA
jgi:hypothetical protein